MSLDYELPVVTEEEGVIIYDPEQPLFNIFLKKYSTPEERDNATLSVVNKMLNPNRRDLHFPTAYVGRSDLHGLPGYSLAELEEIYDDYLDLDARLTETQIVQRSDEGELHEDFLPYSISILSVAERLSDARSLRTKTGGIAGTVLAEPVFEWGLVKNQDTVQLTGKLLIAVCIARSRNTGTGEIIESSSLPVRDIPVLKTQTSINLTTKELTRARLVRRGVVVGCEDLEVSDSQSPEEILAHSNELLESIDVLLAQVKSIQ